MSRTVIASIGAAALLALGGAQPAGATTKHHASTSGSHVVSGEVITANAADHSFVIRTHTKAKAHDMHFVLATAGEVKKGAQPAAFDDLKPAEKVKVTYRLEQKKQYAEKVEISGAQTASAAPAHKSTATK